ncbi:MULTISPECIES: 3D-(3,5/4)-trihydroxycyclohexane-1,2-dione acylhydrolase (decyclizing) [unclassified Sphingomonas]|uniref:3D-(3,5/4)-trihydroxycyclohexane-1,2-dione acylhydrolase (decyclizing) n=1 Tax=unclassified Sphingomonas TaxID=196159 RepID=UPI0006F4FDAC|nr:MULTISPECIES: 3D-(3,5/4)-trihydroxycyclohexane-1,2-dione acylhydrolase (decyclizing) [unclassified Sphingomonas]KQM61402.1 3D-(3,5/4)-trihydroxycyclohexane-1,2-dione acylhydrolase (decyclizing) [Sphingomonas sp. Leaf16]KQN12497.1 3D-(3,5/4)-trihydroxycyclohexane-1,2-dione acylhydrolase (decyclizing) [Sphingomonas sp. Leaf29]KQN18977.1 3D-(3,5/4)-trihydroxycyclohexane-1,2-dione acylhydrolase (decyclizing) [Sphingomonas sp. Leaf32]
MAQPPILRLTAAQAIVRWMIAQRVETADGVVPFFAGIWAIFGHGNVAGLGEALAEVTDDLPTLRAHSEQGMAHAAVAFAKAHRRERAMACTSSIGPGATNLVTAAAVAHVNRLPLLLLPGDVFAGRRPDPVLQQLECPSDPTATVNDCLRPVSRLFDRIARPEQLIDALPRAMAVLTDPALCGPVTLCLCQDVQAEAFDYPAALFRTRTWRRRRAPADPAEVAELVAALRSARSPLVIAGGGVLYARAEERLARFARDSGIPVVETQAGKGTLSGDHPQLLGGIGVTGTQAANDAAAAADVIVAIGTRLQDFTTGSRTLFADDVTLFQVNVAAQDVAKHDARPVLGDAAMVLDALAGALGDWRVPTAWRDRCAADRLAWDRAVGQVLAPGDATALPGEAQVIGAVARDAADDDVIVCAAGGLPGELHKLWRVARAGGYHAEYGFSCMGYEIAGGLGVALAMPGRRVTVMVGDGSYLMLNSEIATAVAMGCAMTIVLVDNGGFGCIERLQRSVGGASFGNLRTAGVPAIDFVAHARSLGAAAERVDGIAALEAALPRARERGGVVVVVVATDPMRATAIGGHWWDVPVPAESTRADVRAARQRYDRGSGA